MPRRGHGVVINDSIGNPYSRCEFLFDEINERNLPNCGTAKRNWSALQRSSGEEEEKGEDPLTSGLCRRSFVSSKLLPFKNKTG